MSSVVDIDPKTLADPKTLKAVMAAVKAAIAGLPLQDPLDHADAIVARGPGLPADSAMALRVSLTGDFRGDVTLVMNSEMVTVFSTGVMTGLNAEGLLQPALVAAAEALGCTPGAVAEADLAEVSALENIVAVPLLDEGNHVATLQFRVSPAEPAIAAAPAFDPAPARVPERRVNSMRGTGIEMLGEVEMEVTVEIGRTRMAVRDLLNLMPGQVIELDRAAGSPADLYVHGTLLARGEIVVVDEEFGIRITEIVGSGLDSAVRP